MPLIWWSKNLFQDRIDFEDSLSQEEVEQLIADKQLKVLQCSSPINTVTWELLNEEFFTRRPEVQLRVYGFYSSVCDLSFTSFMTNVRHFSADCLMNAVGLEHLASMDKLDSLGVGVYHLEEFDFLKRISPDLRKLFLGRTKSKKPDISPLSRFKSMEEIYIEGHQKNIEILSTLQNLKRVVLRSISTTDISYIRPLLRLWSLEIKLGGIKDFSDIEGMEGIKYLELWQVRGLSDIGFISTLMGLQFLSLQSLRQVTALPSFKQLVNLRRITIDNMKGLRDISSLETSPALEEFVQWGIKSMQPEDYLPLMCNPKLKRAAASFGSVKKDQRFYDLLIQNGIDTTSVWHPFEFV